MNLLNLTVQVATDLQQTPFYLTPYHLFLSGFVTFTYGRSCLLELHLIVVYLLELPFIKPNQNHMSYR